MSKTENNGEKYSMDEKTLIEEYKWLHRHPELGRKEYETTAHLKDLLRQNGIRLLETGLETGTIAVIGNGDGPVVGLRCDIDALPIREETGLPYASENDGLMHACGHDFHAACMLGVAVFLKEREKQLRGTVKVIFQPAEENDDGGRSVVATGLLNDVKVFYAGHTYPWLEPGTLGIRPGPLMAGADRFSIRLTGRGAHAAHPELSVDVIPAAAALVQSLQTIVSRTVSPFDSAVVSVTSIRAGKTWNIIPEEAVLEGTVRALTPSVRDRIQKQLERIAGGIALAYGCKADCQYHRGPDPVINDESACGRASVLAREMGFTVVQQDPVMGSEDFSEYLAIAPGAFIRVGTGGRIDAHTPKYAVDPAALYPAARFFAALAEKELARMDGQKDD